MAVKPEHIERLKKVVRADKLFKELYPDSLIAKNENKQLTNCIWHDDENASLILHEQHLHCFAGCGNPNEGQSFDIIDLTRKRFEFSIDQAVEWLCQRYGVDLSTKPDKPRLGRADKRSMTAVYPYVDEHGEPLFECVRFEPKKFAQRRIVGPDQYTWNLEGIRLVLYNLQNVMAADTVFFVEGEKDVHTLNDLGFVATCNPMGAKKLPLQQVKHGILNVLTGKNLIFCPDNDPAGIEHVEQALSMTRDIAATRKKLHLAGVGDKGDITDFVKLHGSDAARVIRDLVEHTPESTDTGPQPLIVIISDFREACKEVKVPTDYNQLCEVVWKWFIDNSARFSVTRDGEPYMVFRNRTIWINSSDRQKKLAFESMLHTEGGLFARDAKDSKILDGIRNLCVARGTIKNALSWMHTDTKNLIVYVSITNDGSRIAKLSPNKVEIWPNGENPDNIFLQPCKEMDEFEYQPNLDFKSCRKMLDTFVMDPVCCTMRDKKAILAWVMACFLTDFTSTRPTLRSEGLAGSGKTYLMKALTCWIYGHQAHQRPSVASAYVFAEQAPILAIDNMESDNCGADWIDFLCVTTTRGAKTIRKAGTDEGTRTFHPRGLTLTNGIESIASDRCEIMRRSVIVRFDEVYQNMKGFMEVTALDEIVKRRDYLMSFLLQTSAKVLAMIKNGDLQKMKGLIDERLLRHSKFGCNDYFSVMGLIMAALNDETTIKDLPTELHTWIMTQDVASGLLASESNMIAMHLIPIFRAHAKAADSLNDKIISEFEEKYRIRVRYDKAIVATSKELVLAMSVVAKDSGTNFPYRKPSQLAQRILQDRETLGRAGFLVEPRRNRANLTLWTIKQESSSPEAENYYDISENMEQTANA